jgi:hypothetical protein
MKNILLLLLLNVVLVSFSQNGVYLTKEDYINKKLTDERTHSFRSNNEIRIYNKGDKSSEYIVDYSKVWGIKRGATEYRIIEGRPHAILESGTYYYYGGIGDNFYYAKDGKSVLREVNSSELPYIGKGLDGVPQLSKTYADTYRLLGITDVKAFKKEFVVWLKAAGTRFKLVSGEGMSIGGGGYPHEVAEFVNSKLPNLTLQPRFPEHLVKEGVKDK